MIPLALTKTPALPGTSLDSPNPWHDKLRMVRYDDMCGDWLLSTSEVLFAGFTGCRSREGGGSSPGQCHGAECLAKG